MFLNSRECTSNLYTDISLQQEYCRPTCGYPWIPTYSRCSPILIAADTFRRQIPAKKIWCIGLYEGLLNKSKKNTSISPTSWDFEPLEQVHSSYQSNSCQGISGNPQRQRTLEGESQWNSMKLLLQICKSYFHKILLSKIHHPKITPCKTLLVQVWSLTLRVMHLNSGKWDECAGGGYQKMSNIRVW